MDTILKVIDDITNDRQVKSIINSVNDNQEKSKNWLLSKIDKYIWLIDNPKICVAAGWYGHLADKLKHFTKEKVLSFDKDPNTKFIGNKLYKDVWFKVMSIEDFKFKKYNVVICTSCEHLNRNVIDDMIDKCMPGTLIALQSNNYKEINDHINCSNSVDEFEKTLKLNEVFFKDTLKFDKYDRYMIIGVK